MADSPLDLLPSELWEAAFLFLTRPELLVVAAVCVAFNELGIRVYLGSSPDDLLNTTGSMTLNPRSLRAMAIYAPSRTLQASRLNYNFVNWGNGSFEKQLSLRLRPIISRCEKLETLYISLSGGLLWRPRRTRVELAAVLAGLAQRVAGPMVVVNEKDMFTYRPTDMLACDDSIGYNPIYSLPPGLHSYAVKVHAEHYTTANWTTETRCHDGSKINVRPPTNVWSVDLQLVQANPSPSFSLLVINPRTVTVLSLGDTHRPSLIPYLTGFLEHVFLPHLRTLHLSTHTLQPDALRMFLVKHPLLTRLNYAPRKTQHLHSLLPFPLAHPGLISMHIVVRGRQSSHGLIPALVTCPNLRTFEFTLPAFTSRSSAKFFLDDLRCIASSDGSVELQLRLVHPRATAHARRRTSFRVLAEPHTYRSIRPAAAWAHTHEAQAAAASLSCVSSVEITAHSGLNAVLVALPNVQRVHFELHVKPLGSRRVEGLSLRVSTDFLVEAQAALGTSISATCQAY
ncbi:hypothetical protein C8F01DRAFT_1157600 [Mycena amicta]|nr:hypothetical protein C8F01DRAFT_1157600 [Mycena amicta]